MEWILFGLFLVFVIGRMAGGAGKRKHDFAGNSITSYFLLEEFIDEPSRDENEPEQDEVFQDQEEDWFKNEWD
ncbi:MAG: hypothetical protein U9P36_03415 [Thermodesulfobacteriota bacterium]|nr:hypothetical protein [Thermodesulfobacteriota bacterium]